MEQYKEIDSPQKTYINTEGQTLLSFAFGVLSSPYLYGIVWVLLFLIVYEVIYFIIYRVWALHIRLGLIVAYLLGILTGIFALDLDRPPWW